VFDVSMSEIVVILIVALIVLGPRQLAEAARVMGKMYRDLQKMSWEMRQSINLETLTSSQPDKDKQAGAASDAPDRGQSAADVVPSPGEKWGADFYADLLESSSTESKDPNEAEVSAVHKAEGQGHEGESKREPGP